MSEQENSNVLNLQVKNGLLNSIEEVCESRGMTMSQLITASISHTKGKTSTVSISLDSETKLDIENLSHQQGIDADSAILNSLEQYIYKLKYEKAVLEMHEKEREGGDVLMSFKVPRRLKDAFTHECSKKELSAAREIRRLMRSVVAEASV